MSTLRKNRGFTLIETMIAFLIFATILSLVAAKYSEYRRDKEKVEILEQHVQQFKTLVNAAGNKVTNDYSTITDDSSGSLNISAMTTESFLPENFGEQYTTNARDDLLGHWFRAYYNKSLIEFNGREFQTVRLLITTEQSRSYNVFPSTVIPNKFADITSNQEYNDFVTNWYTQISRLAAENDLVAGIIEANTRNIRGVNDTFSFVLNAAEFNVATRPFDRVVFFWGWPDLNGFAGGEPPGGGPEFEQSPYADCSITLRSYTNGVEQSSQCDSVAGFKTLVDLEVGYPSPQTTPFYSIPGIGSFYGSVTRQAITDLSSVSSLCYTTARLYCQANGSPGFCGTTDSNRQTQLTNECLSTPVFQIVNNVFFGGGIYRTYEMGREGAYRFGNINGTTYEVDLGGVLPTQINYTLCCPVEVPDLD